jgi:hypothetical protein
VSKVVRGVIAVALIVVSAFAGQLHIGVKLASILFSVGTSLALGVIAQSLSSKPRARRNGQEIEYAGTVEPRRIIYGTNKVSGMNVIPPWLSGDNNQYLHQVLALAGHEVAAITDVYFNDDTITSGSIGDIANNKSSGKVTSGDYADKAWIRRYRGTTDQAVDYILNNAFTDWTSSHRGREVPYIAVQFEFDEEVYATGKPEVSCLVRGKKCYDPREDTEPGADPTNIAFIAFTDNPALILADYLTSERLGLGEESTRINWDLVVVAANICDELVEVPPSQTPALTQKRYTCNVVLEVALDDESLRANITTLAAAMLGNAVFTNGVWKIYAGAASESTFELDEDSLGGNFNIRSEIPSNEKYNYVRGQFVDKYRRYQLSEFEPRENATYEIEDNNRRLPREVVFTACVDPYEAQRNAMIILKRSRCRKQLTGLFGMSAFKIRIWDVGTITLEELGWDNQLVRCIAWSFGSTGEIEATFLEEDPSDWDDPLVSDYGTPQVGIGPGRAGYIPPEPLNFLATSVVDGIRFSFDYPAGHVPGTRAYVYEGAVGSDFEDAVRVTPNFLGSSFTVKKTDSVNRHYWLTFQNMTARPPVESQPVGPVKAKALAITTGFHAAVTSSTAFKKLVGSSSGSTGTVTVSPVNGTAPFTYAWLQTEGDASINATSPSSATTSFSNTGMVDQESNTGVFQCTITDATAATATIEVRATFFRDDGL